MDAKKTNQQANVQVDHALQNKKARDFFADIKAEFKNINWTSRDELITYTKIVVGTTFLLGMGIYAIDLAIHATLGILSWLTRLIAG